MFANGDGNSAGQRHSYLGSLADPAKGIWLLM
ncbi:hypothetical protein A2U01_0104505, partial [Trifolium medium]|nr:hypothetical protein [Trifolium medium]